MCSHTSLHCGRNKLFNHKQIHAATLLCITDSETEIVGACLRLPLAHVTRSACRSCLKLISVVSVLGGNWHNFQRKLQCLLAEGFHALAEVGVNHNRRLCGMRCTNIFSRATGIATPWLVIWCENSKLTNRANLIGLPACFNQANLSYARQTPTNLVQLQ